MECQNVKEKLSAYIDARLTSGEKLEIEGHLKACPVCSLALKELKKTVEILQGTEDVEPPPWLERRIIEGIREEAGRKKGILQRLFFPLHIKVPLEVFATIAIAVTAFYVFRTVGPEIGMQRLSPAKGIVTEEKYRETETSAKEEEHVPHTREMKTPATAAAPRREPELQKEPAVKMKRAAETADALKEEAVPRYMHESLGKVKEGAFSDTSAGFKAVKPAETWSVLVGDIAAARDEIERAVNAAGGEVTGTMISEHKTVITAEINAQSIKRLIADIGGIGKVEKEEWGERDHGEVVIKIEVLEQPVQTDE